MLMYLPAISGEWLKSMSPLIQELVNWSFMLSLSYSLSRVSRYSLQYQEPIPCEQLIMRLCDLKQAYTQFGGKKSCV